MRDGFAGVLAIVHDEAEAVGELKFPRHGASDKQQVAEHGLVVRLRIAYARDPFFWDDEQVHGRLRLDVVQDDAVFVLMFELCGNLAVDDFLKNCFHQ